MGKLAKFVENLILQIPAVAWLWSTLSTGWRQRKQGREKIRKASVYQRLVKERHQLYESQTFNDRYFEIERQLRLIDSSIKSWTTPGGNYRGDYDGSKALKRDTRL